MRNKDKREQYKYTKEYKSNIVISSEMKEILEGVILGDATVLRRYKVSVPVVKFSQSEKNKDYLFHLYDIFEPLVATPPKKVVYKREKDYVQYAFQTLAFDFLNEYRERYYDSNGKKIVPRDLEEKLTARSLAMWHMDDGCKQSSSTYTLHTECFKRDDVDYLREVLNRKFNIKTSRYEYSRRDSEYNIIVIKSNSAKIFRDLVDPYVVGSMRRKL